MAALKARHITTAMATHNSGVVAAVPSAVPAILFMFSVLSLGALLLDEAQLAKHLGRNTSNQPTNYSYWRWSTTGGHQGEIHLSKGDRGAQVDFEVQYCDYDNSSGTDPYPPDHDVFGCYRSELAVRRDVPNPLEPWTAYVGGSKRWFGLSLKLPVDFSWDELLANNGPSFQIHDGNGPGYKGLHPVLELTVDATGCDPLGAQACATWTATVTHIPNDESARRTFTLGKIRPGSWEDWVIATTLSPQASRGSLAIWRNGAVVVPPTTLPTAYNDTKPPYLKFGVYKAGWKAHRNYTSRIAAITYSAVKVGDEHSSFAEVDTRPTGGSGTASTPTPAAPALATIGVVK